MCPDGCLPADMSVSAASIDRLAAAFPAVQLLQYSWIGG